MPKPKTWGGKRRGSGRKVGSVESSKPRCPCGDNTLKRAKARAFDCCKRAGKDKKQSDARYAAADFRSDGPMIAMQITDKIDLVSRRHKRYNEKAISPFARSLAKSVITDLGKIADFIPQASVLPLEGGLQLMWKSAQGRSVQMFCSPEVGRSYIYSRDSVSHKSTSSPDVSALTLASRLSWLF